MRNLPDPLFVGRAEIFRREGKPMADEQAFEEQGEESLPPSHREWQPGSQAEPDLAQMVEMYDVMTTVNQRLAEHRSQPLRRTIGDTLTWGATVFLLTMTVSDLFQQGLNVDVTSIAVVLTAAWLYNRNLHALDITRAALSLQEFDRRWIGPLFEALSWPNGRIRRIVRVKILSLLPVLTEEDSDQLSARHRAVINALLEESRDTDLKVAVLKALARIGDDSAVPVVEKLATARVRTPAARRVQREAAICLPRLREQALKQAERRSKGLPSFGTVPVRMDGLPTSQEEIPTKPTTLDSSALAKLEAEREKVARPAMRMAFLIADWCVIVPFLAYQSVTSFASHQPLLGLAFTGAAVGATQLYRVSLSSKRVAMMRKQIQQHDVRGVGLLAEALTWPEKNLQYEAASALTVLLPLLKANNASLLSAPQRECLHNELNLQNAKSRSELMVAILKAFQQVGDNAAIPFVEQLAASKARTPQELKVVEEAQECLPYLRLRAGNNTASHTLLRASTASDTGATDNLLRPAWENPETKPEQLLRPGNIGAD